MLYPSYFPSCISNRVWLDGVTLISAIQTWADLSSCMLLLLRKYLYFNALSQASFESSLRRSDALYKSLLINTNSMHLLLLKNPFIWQKCFLEFSISMIVFDNVPKNRFLARLRVIRLTTVFQYYKWLKIVFWPLSESRHIKIHTLCDPVVAVQLRIS